MIFKKRSEHWFLSRLDWCYPPSARFYTTLGKIVYTPGDTDNVPSHVIAHEETHIAQQKHHGLALFLALYILSPYHRWKFEREAYLVNIKRGEYAVDDVVEILWRGYFYPWPRSWMRAWFAKNTSAKS